MYICDISAGDLLKIYVIDVNILIIRDFVKFGNISIVYLGYTYVITICCGHVIIECIRGYLINKNIMVLS